MRVLDRSDLGRPENAAIFFRTFAQSKSRVRAYPVAGENAVLSIHSDDL